MVFKTAVLIIISAIGIWLVFNKRRRINLLDILIISHVLFFGLYPIVDLIKKNYVVTTGVFIITISYIGLTLTAFLVIFNILVPPKQRKILNFAVYIKKVLQIPQRIVIVFFFIALGIISYYFLKHGLIFRVINEDLPIVNTYKQVILSIVFPLFSLVTISSISRILLIKNRKINFINFLFLGLITGYWLFYGRRELIFHFLIMGLAWFVSANKVISRKVIVNSILGLGLIVIGSNIYQNLRWDLMSYSSNKEINLSKSILEMAFDFESSNQNLGERSSALPMMSRIIDEIVLNEDFSKGELFLVSLENVMPSLLFADKTFIDEDFIVARQLRIPYTDFNTTLYSSFYVDFGMFSICLLPCFLFLYYVFVSLALLYLKHSQIIFIIVYAEVLGVTLNMEAGITSIFASIRIILVLLLVYFLLNRALQIFFKIKL